MDKLNIFRNEIDKIDLEITKLFEKRLNTVKNIGIYKKNNDLPVLNESREEQVISKVQSYLKDESYSKEIKDLFVSIMDICKSFQNKL